VVLARVRTSVTTVAALASTVAALVATVTVAVVVVAAVVGTVVVTSVLALRSLATLRSVMRRRGNTGRVSTARRNGVVGVRRIDSGTVVSVVNRDGVSNGLSHTLTVVGRVRVGVGLSLGDNILAGVSRHGLMGLAGLGGVGVDRLVRLAGLVVSRLGNLSDRADSCGNSDGLGGDMANRAVDNGRRALSNGVCLGGVDSAGGVLSSRVSRHSHVAGLSVDSGEASVSGLGGRSSVDSSVVVVSVGNSGRSSENDT
jgi:hypothetical protein